jgi:putative transposase
VSDFIDLETAARRSGKSIGHLRRLCGEKWLGDGLARLEQPRDGGRSAWMVSEEADPSLARVKFADQLSSEFDLRKINERKRRGAMDKKRILDMLQADLAAGTHLNIPRKKVIAGFIDKLLLTESRTVSTGTLYNWLKASKDGIGALVDGRGGDEGQSFTGDHPFINEIKRLYLRQSQPGLKVCYDHARLIAEDQSPPWPICSFKTVQRRIAEVPEAVLTKLRFGATAYKNTCLPTPRRDYSSLRSNEWWCADHHQLDVIVNTAPHGSPAKLCRPWLTAWEDLRSRKIVGWHLFAHDPNHTTILLALRSACLADGIPEVALVDNGKDFDSYALQGETKAMRFARRKIKVEFDSIRHGGVLGALGVKVVHAIVHNAKAKPVERFFGTLCARFSKLWPTYCGRNPEEKPENLPDQLARGNAPSMEDFASSFATWVDVDYNGRVHEGDSMEGLTPAAAFEQFMVSRRVARAEELQLLIQKTSQPITATRHGLQWDGIEYGRGDPALFQFMGKKLYLRVDPDDVTQAAVYTLDDIFVTEVRANVNMPFGASEEEFRRAAREKKQINDLTSRYYNLGPKRNADVIELMALKRDEEQASRMQLPPPTDPNPPSMKPVRTPLEGQSIPLRKAVGAEAMSPERQKPKTIDLLAESEDFEISNLKSPPSGLRLYEEEVDP